MINKLPITNGTSGRAVARGCGACCTKIFDLSVSLSGSVILDRINLHMHCGELIALIGPNGAGKTTLLRAMLGEIPYRGKLQFLPSGKSENRPPRLGYVPQQINVDRSSPISVLDLFASVISRRPIWLTANRSVIREAAQALQTVESAELLRKKLGDLSGGELQRVLLGLALCPRPDILLLDEPVSGIDQAGLRLFYQTISHLREKYDLAILLISHDLTAIAQIADRVVFLNRSIIAEGEPKMVLASKEVQRCFGVQIQPDELAASHSPLNHHPQTTPEK